MTWVGSVPPVGENIRCKRSAGGAEVTCVGAMGVYENGTYVYEGWNFNSGNYLFTTDTK